MTKTLCCDSCDMPLKVCEVCEMFFEEKDLLDCKNKKHIHIDCIDFPSAYWKKLSEK